MFDRNKKPTEPSMDTSTTVVTKNGGTTKGTKAATATKATKPSKDTKKKHSK